MGAQDMMMFYAIYLTLQHEQRNHMAVRTTFCFQAHLLDDIHADHTSLNNQYPVPTQLQKNLKE